MSAHPDKAAWRRRIARRRDDVDRAALEAASIEACRRVLALDPVVRGRAFGCYVGTAGEPDTRALLEAWWQAGCRVCVPARDAARDGYGMAAVEADSEWRTGAFGIREPAQPRWTPCDALDAVIVPGVAFDRHGVRLGRGGGYYDRLLAGSRAVRIGLAFDFQVVDALPREPHDIPMHFVVTEMQTIAPPAAR